jgi:hypothetical protein
MDATLLRADGTKEDIQPANGTDFTFDELYPVLGCDDIEVINTGDPAMIMLGDEEARFKNDFLINREATRIFRESAGIPNTPEGARAYFNEVMAGMGDNVIFCGDREEEPYTIAGDVVYCPSVMLK